jgi:hypothetical protein
MDAAYVFRVTFSLDASGVDINPERFETVVRKPAAEPGTDGWRFFEVVLWRGEVTDAAHARSLAENWLSVPVESVTFSELQTDEAYLDALRDAIADAEAFDDTPQTVLHAHLGSSIRVR